MKKTAVQGFFVEAGTAERRRLRRITIGHPVPIEATQNIPQGINTSGSTLIVAKK